MEKRQQLINTIEDQGYVVVHSASYEYIVYNYLLEAELFTEEELNLVTNINGFNRETLNDMIFARYGYRDLEQMLDY